MADNERDIHIPFNTGFDDFTDDRWKPDGHIKSAINCEWNQEGRIEKRRGFEAFSEAGVNVGSLWNYGSTFVSMAPEGLSIYNPQQDSLSKTMVGIALDVKSYASMGVLDVGDPQVSLAYSSNIYMVAWADYSGTGLYACFFDAESKRPLTESYKIASGDYRDVVALANNGFFAIVCTGPTGAQFIYRNPLVNPVHDNWSTESLGALYEPLSGIDAYNDGDDIYIVGQKLADDTRLRVVKSSVANTGSITTTDLIWSLGAAYQWQINAVPDGFGIVAIANTAAGVIAHCSIDTTPAYVRGPVDIGFDRSTFPTIGPSGDPTYPECITAYRPSGDDLILQMVFYDPAGPTQVTKQAGFTFPRSASWVDPVNDDILFVMRRVDDPLDPTSIDGFTSNGVGFVSNHELADYDITDALKVGIKSRYGSFGVQTLSSIDQRPFKVKARSATMMAWAEVAKVATDPPTFQIAIVEADSAPTTAGKAAELAGGMYCSRGPSLYDGIQLSELGFWGSPYRSLFNANTVGGANLTLLGTYLYSYLWETTNALGDTLRSVPSAAPAYTLAGTENSTTSEIGAIGPTNWGTRFNRGTDPYIVAFRSQDSLTTVQRLGSQSTLDSTAFQVVTVVDEQADTDIINNPVIYTDGAQLPPVEHVQPPCFTDICVYKNRVVGVADDGITLWVSTDKRLGECVRFNEALNIQVADGGRIYAICAEQDRLLLFKQNDVYVVYGEGADERGVGASFNLPIPLAQNIGCTRPESVLATPVGTFFQGGPGIMRIVGQQVDFIGNAVRDTFPGVVSSVTHSAEQQKVFFACHDEALTEFMILVYDYRFQRWTEWTYEHPTGQTGESKRIIGMVVYDGRLHCALGDRFYILRQKRTTDTDSHLDFTDTWVPMTVTFAPIKTSGPQGFQHIKKVMVIGEQGSRHNLTMAFANNYNSTDYQSVSWTAAVIDTWTTLPLEQFSAKPSQPRCEAIRITVSDAEPSTGVPGTGQGLKLVGLSLTLANKTRLMRLGSPYKR